MSSVHPKVALQGIPSFKALKKLEHRAYGRIGALCGKRDPIMAIFQRDGGLPEVDCQEKHRKMAESEFAFYRGTNYLFWQDFGRDPRLQLFGSHQTRTWVQGDLHANNFGAYENSAGEIAYSINDFDDAVVADYQYDLWRMAVSIATIARDNGISAKHWGAAIDAFSLTYLEEIEKLVGNDRETRVYFTADNTYSKLNDFLERVERKSSRKKMLGKWLVEDGSATKFNIAGRPDRLASVSDGKREAIHAAFPSYGDTLSGNLSYDAEHFRILDIARRKNAGIGSLGLPRYYVAIAGRGPHDRRILDVKWQGKPSAYHCIRKSERQHYKTHFGRNHAKRHAAAYRSMTLHTDDYLGWIELPDGVYSIRERSPYKETFDTTQLTTIKSLRKLCEQWGKILATCHSRADRHYDATIVPHCFEAEVLAIVTGHEALFCQLVRDVALTYMEVVTEDWQAFKDSDLCPDSASATQ